MQDLRKLEIVEGTRLLARYTVSYLSVSSVMHHARKLFCPSCCWVQMSIRHVLKYVSV